MDINLDSKTLEACTKTVSSIGSTTYYNICNGSHVVIPWGSADWFGAAVLTLVGVAIIAAFIGLGVMVWRD